MYNLCFQVQAAQGQVPEEQDPHRRPQRQEEGPQEGRQAVNNVALS